MGACPASFTSAARTCSSVSPFNIASYALLHNDGCPGVRPEAGRFCWTGGDCHLYLNHLDKADEQLTREPRGLPKMRINPEVKDILGSGSRISPLRATTRTHTSRRQWRFNPRPCPLPDYKAFPHKGKAEGHQREGSPEMLYLPIKYRKKRMIAAPTSRFLFLLMSFPA